MRRIATFLAAVAVLSLVPAVHAEISPQIPIAGAAIPQFAQPLPTLSIAPQHGVITTVLGSRPLKLRMCEFRANMLPPEAVAGYGGTWVWGYLVDPTGTSTCADLIHRYGGPDKVLETYIGPVVVNERGKPTAITWVNDLGDASTTNVLAYRYSTDQTIHWADPAGLSRNHAGCVDEHEIPAFGSPCAQNYSGPIPAVAHLHGGEVPPEVDGGPDSWFTSSGETRGHKYYSSGTEPNAATYTYPNTQEAAPIWFHDHTLGATRLNVYAGLAGAYFIVDPDLALPSNLHPLTEVVPLVLQDRMFDENGQLFFPAGPAGGVQSSPNPHHPYWVPEFVGDTIVVNGKVWPFVNVEAKRYRFLFLNGSNARTYDMTLSGRSEEDVELPLWVIGTDGGYLDAPVRVGGSGRRSPRQRAIHRGTGAPHRESLVIMPGERYEVIIDFSRLAPGTRLILGNTANAPFPDGDPSDPDTVGRIVEFRVVPCASGACGAADRSYDPASGQPLRRGEQKIVRLANPSTGALAGGVTPQLTRALTLNEVMGDEITAIDPVTGEVTEYEGGPLEVLVNNTEYFGESSRTFADFTPVTVGGVRTQFSELPQEGSTEVWEIVNLTADAHPIHLHLVQFQLMNRQPFDVDGYLKVYDAAFPEGVYRQGFGPPLDYRADRSPAAGGKMGGNPDVSPHLYGRRMPADPNETGWKDTVIAYPGQVTRFAVRWAPTHLPVNAPAAQLAFPFDPTGEGGVHNYVWHCHIIDHEDNEMMRPHMVQPNPVGPTVRALKKGKDF
jgi:spore coat protein A